ncbi:hypothetical protein HD806DRAFT_524245 [Xylariaceae sp. AK1471]|nr:hypothetical protein HD806DRAFT_524245 [Xylariaceae sp. AK1471]
MPFIEDGPIPQQPAASATAQPPEVFAWACLSEEDESSHLSCPINLPWHICTSSDQPESSVLVNTIGQAGCMLKFGNKSCLIASKLPMHLNNFPPEADADMRIKEAVIRVGRVIISNSNIAPLWNNSIMLVEVDSSLSIDTTAAQLRVEIDYNWTLPIAPPSAGPNSSWISRQEWEARGRKTKLEVGKSVSFYRDSHSFPMELFRSYEPIETGYRLSQHLKFLCPVDSCYSLMNSKCGVLLYNDCGKAIGISYITLRDAQSGWGGLVRTLSVLPLSSTYYNIIADELGVDRPDRRMPPEGIWAWTGLQYAEVNGRNHV